MTLAASYSRQGDEALSQLQKRSRGQFLGAKLKHARSPIEKCAREVQRRPPGAGRHVHVDDRVKGMGAGGRSPLAAYFAARGGVHRYNIGDIHEGTSLRPRRHPRVDRDPHRWSVRPGITGAATGRAATNTAAAARAATRSPGTRRHVPGQACARFRSTPSSPTRTATRSAASPKTTSSSSRRASHSRSRHLKPSISRSRSQPPDLADSDVVTNEGDGRIYLIAIDAISAPTPRHAKK